MTTPVESAPAKKRIHGAWYALVALPGLIAIWVLATNIPKLVRGFADIRVPSYESGAHDVRLKAGENTIYVEGDDSGQRTRALATMSCTLRDESGASLSLDTVGGLESYTVGGFTGVAQYEVDIAEAGTYNLDCQTDPPVRFAIGKRFPFISIVWCLLALFLALPLTGVTGYIVHRLRNGKRKTARVT
jgi:hypothetical protein